MNKGEMLLAEGISYSLDDFETRLNNNMLVIGASGTGKTRGIVTPALLRPFGSYLISDPKGSLYRLYKEWLESRGYEVKLLDFTDPYKSDRWDPLAYVRTETDAVKMAHSIVTAGGSIGNHYADPFWNENSEMLLTSLILYLREQSFKKQTLEERILEEQAFGEIPRRRLPSFSSLLFLLRAGRRINDSWSEKTALDTIINSLPDSSSAKNLYESVACSPSKTWDSIIATTAGRLRSIETAGMKHLLSSDDLELSSLGSRKMAVFVVVSDTDRSMDYMANIFFSSAMQELTRAADMNGGRLEMPVRFMLDDFATNCRIAEFPRLISSIRSRGISATLLIQAFPQLKQGYGEDWKTIAGNCDTIIYLGGSDIDTADDIARRLDKPMREVLFMPIGDAWIFRRGSEPEYGKVIDPDKMPEMEEVRAQKIKIQKEGF